VNLGSMWAAVLEYVCMITCLRWRMIVSPFHGGRDGEHKPRACLILLCLDRSKQYRRTSGVGELLVGFLSAIVRRERRGSVSRCSLAWPNAAT